jgi:hypothetical protein
MVRDLRFHAQRKYGAKLRPVREFRLLSATESNLADPGHASRPFNAWT